MATIIPPHPLYNRIEIPGISSKQTQFENFVRSVLFPPVSYTWISPVHSHLQSIKRADNRRSPSCLIVQDNSTGFEFFLECRYHRSLIANSCSFFEPNKFFRDDAGRPFFLVLGLGGSADAPNAIFFTDLKASPYRHLYKRHLSGKAIAGHTSVPSSVLWQPGMSHTFLSKQIA